MAQRINQLGLLMKAHRISFEPSRGKQGITQQELLRRMAEQDPEYAERYSHTTVSRWESGGTHPNRQRLECFGKALLLTPEELAGLLRLASIQTTPNAERRLSCPQCGGETQTAVGPGRTRNKRRVFRARRTRTCTECGHTAESIEHWDETTEQDLVLTAQKTLRDVRKAASRIENALEQAGIE